MTKHRNIHNISRLSKSHVTAEKRLILTSDVGGEVSIYSSFYKPDQVRNATTNEVTETMKNSPRRPRPTHVESGR